MSRRVLFVAVAASIALSACGGGTEKTAAGSQATTSTVPAVNATETSASTPTTSEASTTTTAPTTTSTTTASTTTTKPAITKAAYVTQANSICRTMNSRMDALADPGEDLVKLIAMLKQSKQIMTETLSKLRALPVPAGQEAALTAIWAKVDVIVAGVDGAVAALLAGDAEKAIALLEQVDTNTETANAASIAYGLTVCGE